MIMKRNDGRSERSANHPWNHPEARQTAPEAAKEPHVHSVTIKVSRTELQAIRAQAKGIGLSAFIRRHLPEDIFASTSQANCNSATNEN